MSSVKLFDGNRYDRWGPNPSKVVVIVGKSIRWMGSLPIQSFMVKSVVVFSISFYLCCCLFSNFCSWTDFPFLLDNGVSALAYSDFPRHQWALPLHQSSHRAASVIFLPLLAARSGTCSGICSRLLCFGTSDAVDFLAVTSCALFLGTSAAVDFSLSQPVLYFGTSDAVDFLAVTSCASLLGTSAAVDFSLLQPVLYFCLIGRCCFNFNVPLFRWRRPAP